MRKSRAMSFRKLFVVAAAVAALGVAAGGAFAQTAQQKAMIDSAKASSDPALTQAVTVTNNARRDAYARSAQAAGTTADVAAARAFETIVLPRISSGQWYRNAQGQWVQR